MVHTLVHASQTGFIKGRYIGENIRLVLDLIEWCKHQDIAGYAIFLDMMKAYDRCSWVYLHQVTKAVGLGSDYRRWIYTLYPVDRESLPAYLREDSCFDPHPTAEQEARTATITRQVRVNGKLSDPITLQRGVAQGCPLSCLLFVLSVEVFHVMVRDDPLLPGIRLPAPLPTHAHEPGPDLPQDHAQSSGFADDSGLFVTDMGPQWDRCKAHIDVYCRISQARLNMDKTVGLPLGPAADMDPPATPGDGILWLARDQGERYLGARVATDPQDDLDTFWLSTDARQLGLLQKVRGKARNWASRHLSYTGRVLVGKSSISSLIWFYHSVMGTASSHLKLVSRVMWQFLWGNPISDSNSLTDRSVYPHGPTGNPTATLPKHRGGLGAQDALCQAKAFSASWISRLLDTSTGQWKSLAWHSISMVGEQLGLHDSILYCTPTIEERLQARRIPSFWGEALSAWWDLGISPLPLEDGQALPTYEVAGTPLWFSPAIPRARVGIQWHRWVEAGITHVHHLWNYSTGRWRSADLFTRLMTSHQRTRLANLHLLFPREWEEALQRGLPCYQLSAGDTVTCRQLEQEPTEGEAAPAHHPCAVVTEVVEGGMRVVYRRAHHQGYGSPVVPLAPPSTLTLSTREVSLLLLSTRSPKATPRQPPVQPGADPPLAPPPPPPAIMGVVDPRRHCRQAIDPTRWGWSSPLGEKGVCATADSLTVKQAYQLLTVSIPPPPCQAAWESRFPQAQWDWGKIWSGLWARNPYGIPRHKDFQWKLLQKPNNMGWLCAAASCPDPHCIDRLPDDRRRGVYHFFTDCSISTYVWAWVADLWASVTGRHVTLTGYRI